MTLSFSRRLLGGSALALAVLLTACSGSSGGAVATVNGQDISRDEFQHRLESSPVAGQILNQLVQGTLVDQYAKDHNIVIPDSAIDAKLKEIQARYPNGQFDLLIKQQGITMDDVRRVIRQQLTVEKAVSGSIHVSDADVKAAFDKNPSQFDQPEQVHARHILVGDEKTADDIEKQLKNGAKFEDLAKKYSTDPSSKDRGGDLGFFGRHQMVPSFEQAAFSQAPNVVGPPVKSAFGYHIIEVLEHKQAQPASLAKAAPQIRQQLIQQQEATQIPAFLQSLKAKAKIDVHDPQLQAALATGPEGPR